MMSARNLKKYIRSFCKQTGSEREMQNSGFNRVLIVHDFLQ